MDTEIYIKILSKLYIKILSKLLNIYKNIIKTFATKSQSKDELK